MTFRGKRISKYSFAMFALTIFLVLAVLAFFAPRYLAYADKPVKSDAVVLFVGPNFSAREREHEAKRLIKEGYAEYLLIPAIGAVRKNSSTFLESEDFQKTILKFYQSASNDARENVKTLFPGGETRFLNTHLEILGARKMMDRNELKSALFVSSPWHMRRIKIIAESVFGDDEKYVLAFVPTRFEKLPADLLGLCKYAYQSIIQEYLKITAFWAYSYF